MNLSTNSRHAIDAAHESWEAYPPQFARQPLDVRIVVQPEGDLVDEPPVFRSQGNLLSAVYDRHNFGVQDASSLAGYCFVSEKTAAAHTRLRLHFLEAMVYSMLATRHAVPLHAAAVVRNGVGFLLCGPSGAGKSTLSFACARAGWTFVSDDATWLPAGEDTMLALGRPGHARFREDAPRHFPELAQYPAGMRPNGKPTIEAPLADFAHFRTALHCRPDHLVLLDRGTRPAQLVPISSDEVVDRLLDEGPSYGASVHEMHARTLGRLRGRTAFRLQYETLEEALKLLGEAA